MENVNLLRVVDYRGFRRIMIVGKINMDTIQENGRIHAECPYCKAKNRYKFSEVKTAYSECDDSNFVVLHCKKCQSRIWAYMFMDDVEVKVYEAIKNAEVC